MVAFRLLSPFSFSLILLLFTHCSKILSLATSPFHIRGSYSLRIPLVRARHRTTTSALVAFFQSAAFVRHINDGISECAKLTSTCSAFRRFERMSSTLEVAEGSVIKRNLQDVRCRIQSTMEQCNRVDENIRLVAVSKTKPALMIAEAYEVSICNYLNASHVLQRRYGYKYTFMYMLVLSLSF
jgi:hypothetical protein